LNLEIPTSPPQSCPHRPPCPGCPRFGEPGVSRPVQLLLNALAHAHDLPDVCVVSGAMQGFRLRARLSVRGRQNSPKVGLFELDSHRVVHIPNCRVHHPLINQVASVVRRALVDARVTSYSDKAHLGIARYLQVVVERRSQTAQVVLVANSATAEPLEACFALIAERLGHQLHSLWFNANTERTNTILGSQWQLIHGRESVIESFGGPEVHYPPGAFGQNNLDMAEQIIDQVRGHIPLGARVVEFYAGVGAIGLSVIDRTSALWMNEVSSQSLHGLDLGLGRLAPEQRAKITVIPGPAGGARLKAAEAQVVVVDPPRKGLDAELREYLRQAPPEKLIYVSCGLESFLQDTAALTAPGGMILKSLQAFNLLPFTEHVETLAVFERITIANE
jgi:23S rRNA (uracil1939-C5)-methyltransferase